MKKLVLISLLVSLFACTKGEKSEANEENSINSEENVTENSGENINPQLEYDSAGRTDVDSVSSPAGADKQVE